MSLPSSALSKTLHSITLIKIGELKKQRSTFENRKAEILEAVEDAGDDNRDRVRKLLSAAIELGPFSDHGFVSNISHWLGQSQFDQAIPREMLKHYEKQLWSKLDAKSGRLRLADLYSRMLTEWLNFDASPDAVPVIQEATNLEDSFEIVEKDRLQQLRDRFEEVVFEPLDMDEDRIEDYLSNLFSEDKGIDALTNLRLEISKYGKQVLTQLKPFDQSTIRWCIKGQLRNDLLNDEKKAILQDFLKDDIVLAEICDVLNMKYRDLKNWSWDAGKEGMPVEPRRQLNGKYRVMMDEDVLQALLLHFIGVSWSVTLKERLRKLYQHGNVWKRSATISPEDLNRRHYYLENSRWGPTWETEQSGSVEELRQEAYRSDFFLCQLPSSVYEGAGGYDDDEEDDGSDSKSKTPKEVKQQLLRQLATEVHIRRALDREVAVVQSDLQWFGTGMSHSTIFAVSRFIGVPEEWIVFFKKFLEAPLNMGPVSEESSSPTKVRIRMRGTPMAHALEKFFGELVLFFMDLAVNQEANTILYRFHDDLWLCAEPETCAKAWKAMQEFAAIMGLEFNTKKTGSVYLKDEDEKDKSIVAVLPKGDVHIGFLKLDEETGDWIIKQEDVDSHMRQLQKQLMNCKSVLSWVQTWNSCIGRFFSHTFGEPANCFGKEHVNAILMTHRRMQEILFDGKHGNGKTVAEHVKSLISERFNVSDIPDAFLYMPEQFGGLGLRNPFISLFLVRETLDTDPKERVQQFLRNEKLWYEKSKKTFEEMSGHARRQHFREVYLTELSSEDTLPEEDRDAFMSMEEYTRWRIVASTRLGDVYEDLMTQPVKNNIQISLEVEDSLKKLAFTEPDMAPSRLDVEQKWLVQYYSKELFDRCDGLSILDKSLLPLGILTMLKNRKVTWQMAL